MSDASAPNPDVVRVRRKNDVNVTFDKLQAQLLRSCKPAVRKLARAAKGRSDFRNDLELRACLGLARIAADLLYGRTLKAPQPRSAAEELERRMQRLLRGGVT
jgi:hypothetical protein